MQPHRSKALKISAIVIAAAVVLFFASDVIAYCFPKQNFKNITGRSLPADVRVTKFESKLCDNLFRSCYYWKLQHPPGAYSAIMQGADFRTEFDDAKGYRDEVVEVLDPKMLPNEVAQGFKLSIDHRSPFLFVHTNGTTSYYYVGTL